MYEFKHNGVSEWKVKPKHWYLPEAEYQELGEKVAISIAVEAMWRDDRYTHGEYIQHMLDVLGDD